MKLSARLSILIATIALAVPALRAQDANVKAAQTAAEAWLALVDKQDYVASWDTAASNFKNAVPQEKWVEAVQGVRGQLGQLKSRTLKGASPTKSPAAPDDEYLVFQFDSAFAQRPSVAELVTMFKEKDGAWRTAGYFVK
jgi:hypothetical protein